MLRGIDGVLEVIAWSVAVFFVVLLFVGPQVVAEDKPQTPPADTAGSAPDAGGPSVDGEVVFTDNCGSCHTLAAAGTSGTAGPNLDDTSRDAAAVEDIVRNGSGGMPSLGDKLSDEEIEAVGEFVADN
jgi:mono/diheme cytochrome c family protein